MANEPTYQQRRNYQGLKDNVYYLPNDNAELERLNFQHICARMILDGRLNLAPIPRDKPIKVLDVGSGTGIWAKDFAYEYPNATVTGVDLSHVHTSGFPDTCNFKVGNVESDWSTWTDEKYDYIHARFLVFVVHDAPKFISQAFEHLNPGGWFEWQDSKIEIHCACPGVFDVMECKHQLMIDWSDKINQASNRIGVDAKRALNWSKMFDASGLVRLTEVVKRMLIGSWGQDSEEKRLGQLNLQNMICALSPLSHGVFSKAQLMPDAEIDEFVAKVGEEMTNPDVHHYAPFITWYGQKPDMGM